MADIDTVGGSFFTSDDGVEVYYKVWKPAATPVACVLAFHGLGDHINRFDHVFTAFAAAGIVVKGMDYRGHGRTHAKNAEKGSIQGYMGPSIARVWDDMVLLSKMEVDGVPKDLPTFVVSEGSSLWMHANIK
ncbi:hypothetical protein HK102_006438 [Quaeritorhiza haematococci]|nr:hypothetical protein HK102_006438 [Quaeritorhiza haematococci]